MTTAAGLMKVAVHGESSDKAVSQVHIWAIDGHVKYVNDADMHGKRVGELANSGRLHLPESTLMLR